MKIQIKDLEPNPFRDMKNYPIDENKIQGLINSINETGFWENILARRHSNKADKFQIAYGHHRLLAIQKILDKNETIDIPIKDLNDETMLRIMAEENNEYYKTEVTVIDETVRVTFEFLKSFYSLGNKRSSETKGRSHQYFKGLPEPPSTGENRYHHSVIAKQISNWIGKNWPEKRIHESLERKNLYEKGRLDKSVEKLPQTAAGHLTRTIKKHELPKEKQRRIVDRIINDQDFSKERIEYEVKGEKFGFPDEEKKKEKRTKDFLEYIDECTQSINSTSGKLIKLIDFKKEFDSDFYRQTFERHDFIGASKMLIRRLEILINEENKNEKEIKKLST